MGFRGRSVQERKRGGTERVIKYIGTTHLLTQRRRSSSRTTQNGFPLPSIQAHVSKIGSLDKVVSSPSKALFLPLSSPSRPDTAGVGMGEKRRRGRNKVLAGMKFHHRSSCRRKRWQDCYKQ